MIGKVLKHRQFRPLARYLTNGGRGSILLMKNLASMDTTAAAEEMEVAAAVSRRCQKPGLHLIVGYSQSEAPSIKEMRDDARRLVKAIGCERNQRYAIIHNEGPNLHFHLSINRVGPDGKAVSDSNIKRKIETELRQIEADRGWQANLGRHAPDPRTGRRFEGQRNSRAPRHHTAPAAVRAALLQSADWQDLRQRLGRTGWRLEIVNHGKGRSGALLNGPDGQRIGAGKIDRDATLSKLRQRLGPDPAQLRRVLEREEEAAQRRDDREKRRTVQRRGQMAANVGVAVLAPLLGLSPPTYRRRGAGKNFEPKPR